MEVVIYIEPSVSIASAPSRGILQKAFKQELKKEHHNSLSADSVFKCTHGRRAICIMIHRILR